MSFQEINIHQAQHMLTDNNTVLLDYRDAQSYRTHHIENAMLAHDALVESLIKQRDRSKNIVIYCYHGNSSKQLAALFAQFGFTSFSVIGGYDEWQRSINTSNTALFQACQLGELEKVQALITAGADINQRNSDGNNALWLACYANNLELIQYLIQHGINIDNQNDGGATALIYASSAGKTDVVRCLLQAGANSQLTTSDDYSALDLAANREILSLLRH